MPDRVFEWRDGSLMKQRELMRWNAEGMTFPDDLTIEEAYQVADTFDIRPFSDDVETMKRAIREAARKTSRPGVGWVHPDDEPQRASAEQREGE